MLGKLLELLSYQLKAIYFGKCNIYGYVEYYYTVVMTYCINMRNLKLYLLKTLLSN